MSMMDPDYREQLEAEGKAERAKKAQEVGSPPPAKDPTPRPSMGRIVLFHDARHSKIGVIRPAIVLFAQEDGLVDLEVFGASAMESSWTRVPPLGHPASEALRCFWTWPPRVA
jgi:hypothetical protein